MLITKHLFMRWLILIEILLSTLVFAANTEGQPPKIGLVLSGGGAKGFVHIGALKVIEEAGIPIDFITGTSMGALIGALYSMGYTPQQLEEIFLDQDWSEFQEDKISRRNVSIIEKDENDIFLRSFPMKGGKVELPAGLIAGQKLTAFIDRLTLPASNIDDFSELRIPFKCIATDLQTGEAVVLGSDNLGEAIRASMSFLTVFTPIEINGRLLVDGGLVRNVPAQDVREMGADMVICVDVSAPLYTRKQLDSLPRIIDQAMSFQGVESNAQQRELCDILIAPDITGYAMNSFESTAELINLGEAEAQKYLPRLKILADSLNLSANSLLPLTLTETDTPLVVMDIRFEGLEHVSKSLCEGILSIKPPELITPDELEQAIANLYGSQYFQRVSYRLQNSVNGITLVVKVAEKSKNQFKFGLHYDSDLKSAVWLNNTFRNILGQGSKLAFNAKLSEMPTVGISYFIYTGWKPGIGFGVNLTFEDFNPYIWNYGALNEAVSFEYRTHALNFRIQTLLSNTFTGGIGFGLEHTLKDLTYLQNLPEADSHFDQLILKGFLNYDTFDRTVYPRNGSKFTTEFNTVMESRGLKRMADRGSYNRIRATYESATSFGRKLVLIERGALGATSGDGVRWKHYFIIGGQNPVGPTVFPFKGLRFLERAGQNLMTASLTLQIEAWKDNYLILETNWVKINAGAPGEDFLSLLETQSTISGYEVKFAYNSVIGPMEFSVSGSSLSGDLSTHINIGYPF